MEIVIRKLFSAFAGFLAGACAMFWVPWAVALVFTSSGGRLGPGSFPRLLGLHLLVALLLSLAWLLMTGAHTLIRPSTLTGGLSLRGHVILGAAGAGLFYLLFPLFTDSPWIIALVVVVAGGILVGLTLRERKTAPSDPGDWIHQP